MAQNSWINWGAMPKQKKRLNPWEQYGTGSSYVNAGQNVWDTLYGTEQIGLPPRGMTSEPSGPTTKPTQKPGAPSGTGTSEQFELPTQRQELGPGGTPPTGTADTSWRDWWTGTGLPSSYNPNWSITTPVSSDEEDSTASFLSWLNAMMPYLSASDRLRYAQQAVTALDPLDDEGSYKYWYGMANQLAPYANTYNNESNYWDRERLRELRRANRDFWTNYSGGEENATGWELVGGIVQNMLNSILGTETAGGNVGSVWDANGPMSRRERRQYQENVNNYLGGLDENTWGAILESIMYPTTNSPRLNAYFRAPSTYSSYPGSYYSYGYSNPRYVGY